jgi:5-methylcytosine-specific restriction endonuclease McrA
MIVQLIKQVQRLSSKIREKKKSKKRSPEWDNVRNKFILQNGKCAACDSTKELQVHHIQPFHLHPELELDAKNLITLCMSDENCHLSIGHGGSFKAYNSNVVEDSLSCKYANLTTRKLITESAKKNRKSV